MVKATARKAKAELTKPTLTIVFTSANAIELSWTEVNGADRYDLGSRSLTAAGNIWTTAA